MRPLRIKVSSKVGSKLDMDQKYGELHTLEKCIVPSLVPGVKAFLLQLKGRKLSRPFHFPLDNQMGILPVCTSQHKDLQGTYNQGTRTVTFTASEETALHLCKQIILIYEQRDERIYRQLRNNGLMKRKDHAHKQKT